jgi:O-antigen/teichoic acid export membrane protein
VGDATAEAGPARALSLRQRLAGLLTPQRRFVFWSLLVAGLTGGLNFLVFLIAARVTDPLVFGQIAMMYASAMALLGITLFGQDRFFIRAWNEYLPLRDYGRAHGALRFSLGNLAIAMLVAGLVVTVVAAVLTSLGPVGIAAYVGFFLMLTATAMGNNVVRTVARSIAGDAYGDVLSRAIALGLVAGALAFGMQVSAAGFFLCLTASMVISFAAQLLVFRRTVSRRVMATTPVRDAPLWRGRSLRIWIGIALESITLHIDVFLIGLILSPVAAGAYFAATRLAAVFHLLANGVYIIASANPVKLLFEGRHGEVTARMREVSILMLAIVLPLIVGIALFGDRLLALFNPDYAVHAPELVILCITSVVMLLTGPTSVLMTIGGGETRYIQVMAVSVAGRLVLVAAGALLFGLKGAAVAAFLVTLATGVALVVACRRTLGVDPSVFALVRKVRPRARDTTGERP